MEPQEKYNVRRRLRGGYGPLGWEGNWWDAQLMWDGRFGGKGCEVWATKRRARGGARGGEGGRGGEGAGQKPSPAHNRKGKNGGAMYLVKSKDLHLSGGKKINQLVFFCSSAWKMWSKPAATEAPEEILPGSWCSVPNLSHPPCMQSKTSPCPTRPQKNF